SGIAMTEPLDRLLARYEYGRLAPELLDIELRAALGSLGDEWLDLGAADAVVRLWNPALIDDYRRTFNAAVDALQWCRYREAVRRMRDCAKRAAAIRALIDAASAADLAEEAAIAVHDLVAIRRLQRLPAVAATEQIVDLARHTIIEGNYTRASRIAAICSRMAAALLARTEATTKERDSIDAAFDDIRTICGKTHDFAPVAEGDAIRDGSLERITRLIGDGYLKLALRLVAELQMELAGRRRFLVLYERRSTMALAFGSNEEIRSVVADRSWDGAFDHYCEAALAGHSRSVESQIARAAAACASLDAAIEEMSHASA
ncbi:MAG: hypothetical protein WB973_10000, partial [Thermoanaerobaculia bacterium]